MSEIRETTRQDAAPDLVIAPGPSKASVPAPGPETTAAASEVPTSGFAGEPARSGSAPSVVVLADPQGETDPVVVVAMAASAGEFQVLAATQSALKTVPAATQPASIPASGIPTIEAAIIRQLVQNPVPPAAVSGPGGIPICTYQQDVKQVIAVADGILAELAFLQTLPGGEREALRALGEALQAAKGQTADRGTLLSLYGAITRFVDTISQSGINNRPEVRDHLRANYDAFKAANGARQTPVGVAVEAVLQGLNLTSVEDLQRALNLTGKDVDGRFGPQTYFLTQLHILSQMAGNLNRRDSLALRLMRQSVNQAKAAVEQVGDLSGDFTGKVRRNELNEATRQTLAAQGYTLRNGVLHDRQGRPLTAAEMAALGQRALADARQAAVLSHQVLQDSLRIHGANLNPTQRVQVDRWVQAYETFFARQMGGMPPVQPDATDVMASVALQVVAEREVATPAPADPALTRLQRGAVVVAAFGDLAMRLQAGANEAGLNSDERRQVGLLDHAGLIRRSRGTVTLVASAAELRAFLAMVETFARPGSPAVAAVLEQVIVAMTDAVVVADLQGTLGFPLVVSPAEVPVAETPTEEPLGLPAGEAAGRDEPTTIPPVVAASRNGDPPVLAAETVTAPAVLPVASAREGRWEDDLVENRRERQHQAEEWREAALAVTALQEAERLEHLDRRLAETRRATQAAGSQTTHGTSGHAATVVTNADGTVIGIRPANPVEIAESTLQRPSR